MAIGRGPDNGELAKKLGAMAYIDSQAIDAAAELQKLGGAKMILATATSAKSMSDFGTGFGEERQAGDCWSAAGPFELHPLR